MKTNNTYNSLEFKFSEHSNASNKAYAESTHNGLARKKRKSQNKNEKIQRYKTATNTKRSRNSSTIDYNRLKFELLENYKDIDKYFEKDKKKEISIIKSMDENIDKSVMSNHDLLKSEQGIEIANDPASPMFLAAADINKKNFNKKTNANMKKKSKDILSPIDEGDMSMSFKNLKFTPDLFISLKSGLMDAFYKQGKLLGQGGYGKVYVVTHKSTGIQRAMKILKKNSLPKEDEKRLFSEMTILKKLDHPNVVKLYELFQDEENYYLVTEYLPGGELFSRIKKKKQLTEKHVAQYMRQILSGIVYIHSHKIVHRDLKPENILFDSEDEFATLKIIDFGAARRYDSKKMMKKRVGTVNLYFLIYKPYYIAPDVLNKAYNEKCDIWSCGIILYILLCGYPPFVGKNEGEIMRKIKSGEFQFPELEWGSISLDVKLLIQKMLALDHTKRLSAKEALSHYWIQKNSFSNPLNPNILDNLINFQFQSKLNTAILTFIATQLLDNKEKIEISKTFQALDKNGDGVITRDELIEGFIKLYKNKEKAMEKVHKIEKSIGFSSKDQIDYTQKLLSKSKIEQAFKIMDIDGNGQISKNELESIMGGTSIPVETWNVIMSQCTQNLSEEVNNLLIQ